MRSALENRVGAVLAKQGIQRPYSDLFGPGGTRFFAQLELPEQPRRRLDSLLALIDDFTREIDQTTHEIEQRARTHTSTCSARSAASGATSRCS
jgi:hypothetical protein